MKTIKVTGCKECPLRDNINCTVSSNIVYENVQYEPGRIPQSCPLSKEDTLIASGFLSSDKEAEKLPPVHDAREYLKEKGIRSDAIYVDANGKVIKISDMLTDFLQRSVPAITETITLKS